MVTTKEYNKHGKELILSAANPELKIVKGAKKVISNDLFMGMHHEKEDIRIACKNFFVKNLSTELSMSFEQVAECDRIMWGYHSRDEQLLYYPFQDMMHSTLRLNRRAYMKKEVESALNDTSKETITKKLTLAMGDLQTIENIEKSSKELKFPKHIEKLYQTSLKVRIKLREPRKTKVNEFMDAFILMGIHSKDDKIRIYCKNFFVKNLNNKLAISLEEIASCNEIIWQRSTEDQDAYWAFMDSLHTLLGTASIAYTREDLVEAIQNKSQLSFRKKLTLAVVTNRNAVLHTLPHKIETMEELNFPPKLEKLYKKSLILRI